MTTVNRRITLSARPLGFPKISDFDLTYAPLPELASGEVLVRSVLLSLDPCLRARMNPGDATTHSVVLGQVLAGGAVGIVVESANSGFEVGATVEGMLGWQELAVVAGREVRNIDGRTPSISTALGILGKPGLIAYFGLLDICAPKPQETVVVSDAAGGVGMVAGQIAKIRGCQVVGVASSEADLSWLRDELGFDAVIDFEGAADFDQRLRTACPAGIDAYFDNAGGAVSDTVLGQINVGARIAVCGQSSQCNLERRELASSWLGQLIAKQARVQGFRVSSYARQFPAAIEQLARWLKRGRLKYREEVSQGLESAPQAFIGMLLGQSQGKQLVQLS